MSETVDLDIDFDDDSAAFLSNLTGEPIPAKPGAEDDDDDTSSAEEALGQTKAPDADPAEPAKAADPDDAELEWGEGETKTKATMRALKDAYRVREESTRFAQEAAQARQQAATRAAQANTALNALVTKAAAKWEPFAKLDFLAISKDPSISPEDFTALRAAAQEALTDYRYLTTELETAQKAQAETARVSNAAEVQACIKELNDPVKGIPGFGKELYNQLVDHAATYGAPRDQVLAITAPWALKVLNDARLYREGLKSAETKVAKVVNKATNVMRPSGAPSNDPAGRKQAMKALRSSGSLDDAAEAFLASFG